MTQPEANALGRLLLVDDEENILRSLKRVLRRGGWEVRSAFSGEAGLAMLEEFQPHVLISDFRMPGMNGVEFLSRVKVLSPRTQRIMLTGQADQTAIEEAINRCEVYRFISKPWNDTQLVLMVQSAFEQHSLQAENQRLFELIREQNGELRTLNQDLEARVAQRTLMLSRAKREWELTFDTLEAPVMVVGLEDRALRRANTAAAARAGRPMTDIGTKPRCHEFLFGRPTACPGCPVGPQLTQQPQAFELHEGEKTYVVSLARNLEEPVAVCTYRDVTQEREMTRRLVESEKMFAIGTLAGGVAHEINNPLGGILAFAQLMQRDAGRSEADLESLQLIEESALRCKRIVESLLKFSRRSHHDDRRPFDLSRCVDDAAVLFRAQMRKLPRARFETKLGQGLPEVFGDPGQMSQVVLNLLQNSLQALKGGEGLIRLTTGHGDGHASFTVTDDGVGIPPEVLSRIFEPHYTTKPPGEGTGLGLSIAYGIVADHQGYFTVESKPGEGSTFSVFLPVRPGGAPTS